ncbi:MAG: PASTA domain-containing protein [Nitrospiraceae bacterium]|nr:PASTA domain-containing protein [Nitrospiraceae bacterium]
MNNTIKIPLYFIGFVLLGFLFAYITFQIISFSKTVDVPDLSGKSLVEANEMLKKIKLSLKIGGEDFDASAPPGKIIKQDAPPGSKLKEQRAVKVIISRGTRIQEIPFVVGEPSDKAESILLQKGFKLNRIIRVHSNSIEKDRVIAQRPGPDDKSEGKVVLIVSAGNYDTVYYCPDFQGKSQEEAIQIAEKLGLKLRIIGSGDLIRSQKPRPGAQIKKGETVLAQIESSQPMRDAEKLRGGTGW